MEPESREEVLTRYLLGDLPEEENIQLEMDYFADEGLLMELQATERDLIDKYVECELSESDRSRFETYFLKSPGRGHKLEVAMALKKYRLKNRQPRPVVEPIPPASYVTPPVWTRAQQLMMAASVILLAGIGLIVWLVIRPGSEIDNGLNALARAYSMERPFAARISGLNFAPVGDKRGNAQDHVDNISRKQAETILSNRAEMAPGPDSYHALGKVYLAERKFSEALDLFRAAAESAPDNAQLHNDIGVTLFERRKTQAAGADSGERLRDLGESLEAFRRAIELDKSLLEPLFNTALVYEQMGAIQEARNAWKRYLEKDLGSPWADEARRHLDSLGDQSNSTSQKRERIFEEFLDAHQSGDEERAWRSFSLGRGRSSSFVVERLLDSHIESLEQGRDEEAARYLSLLTYSGGLELRKAGDSYTSDLARFYSSASNQKALLFQANRYIRSARKEVDSSNYTKAIEYYEPAIQLFKKAGNINEAKYLEYRIGICYLRQPRVKQALSLLESLAQSFERKKYKWLLARTFNALSDGSAGLNNSSQARDYAFRAFQLSEEIHDTNNTARSLVQIAMVYQSFGKFRESLDYLERGLSIATASPLEMNQLWIIYGVASDAFASLGLYTAALGYQREAQAIAVATGNPLNLSRSFSHLGDMLRNIKNYDEATKCAQLALDIGREHADQSVGREMVAYASLYQGHLHLQEKSLDKALACYDQTLQVSRDLDFPIHLYAAHKGKFLCYLAQGDNVSAGQEIETALKIFNENRLKILEESNRNAFFDSNQSIYDLVIDFEYSRMNNFQAAFEYTESCRAPSLLDLIYSGAEIKDQFSDPDLAMHSAPQPLRLAEIIDRLPERAQVLQYAVLEDKLLIWVVSKSGLKSEKVEIGRGELGEKIDRYYTAMSRWSQDSKEADALAAELYEYLIKPVEQYLDRKKYLSIVPDKALNTLPFGALVSSGSKKWLLTEFTCGLAPSSTVFIELSDTARHKSGRTQEHLCSVGNPGFDHALFEDLPASAREATRIAKYYGSPPVLTGKEARESRVRTEMARADVINIATHYVADARSPMLSKLVFAKEEPGSITNSDSDGFLQCYEIYRMKPLNARLVVLSACQTASDQVYQGEGAIGLARPFMALNVPLVVASLWKVDSEATSELISRLHYYRRYKGLSTADALRDAQMEMLKGTNRSFHHPFYWASFCVIGGFAEY